MASTRRAFTLLNAPLVICLTHFSPVLFLSPVAWVTPLAITAFVKGPFDILKGLLYMNISKVVGY